MPLPSKRHVAAVCHDGHIRLIEQEMPALKPGSVLIQVKASLVSPGTEVGGWRALAERRQTPADPPKSKPFGYSNAGVVLQVGEGVSRFKEGDRVACVGGSYAMHADYAVVPHNLTFALPDGVSFEQGAYAMLAATGLHALRRGDPRFGEYAAVAGLGLVGMLTAKLYQLAGCFVVGWDTIETRCQIANAIGLDEALRIGEGVDEVALTRAFTGGQGLDGGVIAFGGNANRAYQALEKSMKVSPDGHPMGTIVVVGGAKFDYTGSLTNVDVRRASRTGPGYHDEAWEFGPSYPPVFMRWTTQTNIELCLRLIASGKLPVDALTTHTIPLSGVDAGIDSALNDPDSILGVVFTM